MVVGYIGVQAPTETHDAVTYAVIPSAETSEARKTLGTACDVFTAVQLATDKTKGSVTLYVTGGTKCAVNKRVDLPMKEIAAVTPSPTTTTPPTKTS